MCISPIHVKIHGYPTEAPQPVACGTCWACIKNRTNDIIGRTLLEIWVSEWSYILTLTYDDKKIKAEAQTKRLIYPDFQQFMKRVRKGKDGHPPVTCRYVAAGEYGSRKGRTHWHVILMGSGMHPQVTLNTEQVYYDHWPWGYTYAETCSDYKSVRYVAKYLTKEKETRHVKNKKHTGEEILRYSLKPLIGAEGIRRLARRQAEMKVPPYNLNYTPPGGHPKHRYSLTKGAAENHYFDELLQHWPAFEHVEKTQWVENAFVRFRKARAEKVWRSLSNEERKSEIDNTMRDLPEPEKAVKRGPNWRAYDEKEKAHRSWLKDVEKRNAGLDAGFPKRSVRGRNSGPAASRQSASPSQSAKPSKK